MSLLKVLALGAVFVACGAAGAAAPSVTPQGESVPLAASASAATPSAPVRTDAAAPPVAVSSAAPAPTPSPRTFTALRSGRVSSLAVGKPPRIGAYIDDSVVIHDAKGLRELPPPPKDPSWRDVRLYFGRDDAPRLMGIAIRAGETALGSVYLRFKGGRWQPEPSELGPLGSPDGALYGVLGFDDPEVVCRPGKVCLVKRLSGWKSVPAHAAPLAILLAGKTAWALAADHVERLEPRGFVALEPARALREPSSLWVDDAGAVWIGEPASESVHRLQGGAWQTFPANVGAPRVLIGDAQGRLWVAGDRGVAHLRNERFELVAGVAGPLSLAVRSGDDLWFAGAAGLYRAQAL